MRSLDDLVSAFECLWEAKLYLLRCSEKVDPGMRARLQAIYNDVAEARDRVEKINVELQEKLPPAQPVER